ncbi:caspase family protein [Oceanibacterium hippocampi]|uniref:Caspase domain protein n=1 Tax=Oceanibacterium hippocampi TaxID=745714 RepID=A0A1Y5RUB8_9PROT|nr:caspase family protein [Oceanibacterium hippocampi]SLN25302.1 Caspase domain protein [Oceanibacterium hippocampi]
MTIARRLAAGLCALFLLAVAIPGAARAAADSESIQFGRYHALVIGINDYPNLNKLKTAISDATAVHKLLTEKYGFQSELLINPTRSEIIARIGHYRKILGESDNFLLYYAGHGILDEGADEGFWLPIDATLDDQANWVSASAITGNLRAMAAKHALVIADSCYSGALTRSVDTSFNASESRMALLRRLSEKRTRRVMSSGGEEPVLDTGTDGHSVFTYALLRALGDNPGVMEGQQLFDNLRSNVVANAEQTPRYNPIPYANDQGGDFLFVPANFDAATMLTAGGDGSTELAYWASVKDSSNPAMVESYLEKYPEGRFATLAALRLEELRAGGALTRGTGDASTLSPEEKAAREQEQKIWGKIRDSNEPILLESFLEEFPDGIYANVARLRLDALRVDRNQAMQEAARERDLWELARDSASMKVIQTYLGKYPTGAYSGEARALLAELQAAEARPQQQQTASIAPPAVAAPVYQAPAFEPYTGRWRSRGVGRCPQIASGYNQEPPRVELVVRGRNVAATFYRVTYGREVASQARGTIGDDGALSIRDPKFKTLLKVSFDGLSEFAPAEINNCRFDLVRLP